ncbi:50S ribosomal protein L32 [Vampirovibrio sp.]|uniref:50S ribosomal protein L32 n=1 Tax=Vampirovibrio sp. TaxID=2717857 RepID=UPI0035930565
MPVPKKRVGHSDQAHRRANWKATLAASTTCPHCSAVKMPHHMCVACGFYNGRVLSEKFHAHHEH